MEFYSILFRKEDRTLKKEAPDFFINLNLNQVVDTLTSEKEEYDLKPFFYTPLHRVETILYRQEIMQDMENASLFDHINLFAQSMREMRDSLFNAGKCSYQYQKERLFLDSVQLYCKAVNTLAGHLSQEELKSVGLIAFEEYLAAYMQSERFISLLSESRKLTDDLSSVEYGVLIKDLRIQVLPFKSETDYSQEVEKIFEKFKQGAVKDYKITSFENHEMDHVEASILNGVTSLYPELFQQIDEFCAKNISYQDETIVRFDREIQFYVAWLQYISKIKQSDLKFCYPEVSRTSKSVCNFEGFDIALAYKLVNEHTPVVCNDFYLKDQERIIIVTGPNQGGKTTFARTFGQLHYLASLGCPVPGRAAKLFLYDKLLTHFEKEEDIETHRSKFEDDLVRIHSILNEFTSDSIIIMNEILSSTSLQDSILLSKKIMEKIADLDALCVWITFIDELIPLSNKTVSMISMVEPENPANRTFKVIRKPADGLAYALSIAEKYRVTYTDLKERIKA